MQNKFVLSLYVLCLFQILIYGKSNTENNLNQDRISAFILYNFGEVDSPYDIWDVRYRMSNYSDKMDSFSGTGKMGIQGTSPYIQFGPEVKLQNILYMNTTLGLSIGYTYGIVLISEAELGFKINLDNKLYIEGGSTLQIITDDLKEYKYLHFLKIGLGLDL